MPHPGVVDDDDLLQFLDDHEHAHDETQAPRTPWRVLIVDDDTDVHKATELAMQGLPIEGQPLSFLHAKSAAEARSLLVEEPDIAVVLLDVVMESDDAGLQLVRHIREELRLRAVRIVLRTGQPGYAPEIETVQTYDINDYKTKSELTRTRLYTVLTAAIRSYRQIRALEANRQGLEMIVEASTELGRQHGLHRFAEGVVTQLCALLGTLPEGLVCVQAHNDASGDARVIAAAGQYSSLINRPLHAVPVAKVRELLARCLAAGHNLHEDGCTVLHFGLPSGRAMAALVEVQRELDDLDRQLLRAFCSNISVGFENVMLYTQLTDQAYNDPLLQLPNRTRFIELLEHNLKSPEGITLALIDLDDFADVNDAFGHRFGDQVLQAVSQRMAQRLGFNTAMARISSNAFGLLGPDEMVNGQRIGAVFDDPFTVAGERLQLSATSGLVRLAQSRALGSELLLDAQIALKRAKAGNRGASQYFSPEMGVDARERFKLLKGLRASFEERRLFVVYQPQVELSTLRVIGAEALLRWRTAEGQFVPPGPVHPAGRAVRPDRPDRRIRAQDRLPPGAPAARGRLLGLPHRGQHLAGAVPPSGLHRHAAPRAGRRRRARLRAGAGDHRVDGDGRGVGRAAGAGGDPRHRRLGGDRRFRDRLLVAEPAAAAGRGAAQDRPRVRARGAELRRRRDDRADGGESGMQPGDARRRRGHRDRGTAPAPAGAGLPRGSGLAVRPAHARGGSGALARRAQVLGTGRHRRERRRRGYRRYRWRAGRVPSGHAAADARQLADQRRLLSSRPTSRPTPAATPIDCQGLSCT